MVVKKPTDSLYHLSHGQREPVSFWVRSLPETNALGESKPRTKSPEFGQLDRRCVVTTGEQKSYGDSCGSHNDCIEWHRFGETA
jgi:hypothetical protein